MKKAISVLLLTVMCAMVFVGCGSGENSSSDLNSTESAEFQKSSTNYRNRDNRIMILMD